MRERQMRLTIWRRMVSSLGLFGIFLSVGSCGGGPKEPLFEILHSAVSPLGELLEPPTSDEEQYRVAMRAWFTRTDADHDGQLSPAEMSAEADRVFPMYDLNGDGEIVYAEWRYFRMNSPFRGQPTTDGGSVRPGSIGPTPDHAVTADADSGRSNDYQMRLPPFLAASRVTPNELRAEALRRHLAMDANGDGAVSVPEYMEQVEGPLRARTFK